MPEKEPKNISPAQKTDHDVNPDIHIGEDLMSSIEGLRSLPEDQQQEAVEDIAFDALQASPVGAMTMNLLKEARARGDKAKAESIVAQRKEFLGKYKREVAFMCGVKLEDSESQKHEYQQSLKDRYDQLTLGDLRDDEIMLELGFLIIDEDTGEETFNYPRHIFPPYINEKWDKYVESVQSHVRAFEQVKYGFSNNPQKVAEWDQIRRIMHNGLAQDVNDFLDLGWDIERSRKFVTKMLEKRIPTQSTDEGLLATDAILGPLQSESRIRDAIKRHHDK